MAAHPNVTIDIKVLENEAFKTKLTTLLQPGDVPDLFQTWGGGDLRQQVEAGLVKDITRRHRVLEGHDQPRRAEHLCVRRQAVRRPVGHRHDRLLVQHEAVQGRRHHRAARDVG